MRIAHYMTGLGLPGGIGSYIRRVSAAQQAAGHEVLFFDLQMHQSEKDPWPGAIFVQHEQELLSQAAERGVEILHAHTLMEKARESPVPLIRTLHGHEPYCPSGSRFLTSRQSACNRDYHPVRCAIAHWIDRCGSARPLNVLRDIRRTRTELKATSAIHVIAVSDYLKTQMERNGYSARRVHTLRHPAVAAGSYLPLKKESQPRFVFLGRLTPEKGVDWLLRSAAVARSKPFIDIAGHGNARDDLEKLNAALGIIERVKFHGWLAAEAVAELLRESRALVFPSLWPEPAGLVVFDAMAQGRAVIASNIGGIPELVSNQTALLVPAGDVNALAEAMDRLAEDAELAEQLGTAGHEHQGQFSLEAHLEELFGLYQLAIVEHRQ